MMSEVLEGVRRIGATVAEAAAANEHDRMLSSEVVSAMRDAGVFAMATSTAHGGPQLSPLQQIEVLEELSAADAAAGWCGMINCDGGYGAAYLEDTVARELRPSINDPAALVAMPGGTATAEGDGFRVQGQWPFASGSSHAELFFLNCIVMDGDGMRTGADGMPAIRMMSIPRRDVEVLDTWYTTGLAATASNDVRVVDVFVPENRTFDLFFGSPVDQAPLYAWRWFFITKLAAVPLGLARAAIEDACSTARTKLSMPAMRPISEDGTVQANLGRAHALVRSARCYVEDAVGRTWETVCRGDEPSPVEWADTRLAMTTAFTASREATALVYEALGTTGVYRKSRLDRQMRDVITMGQHVLTQTKTYAAGGKRLLGLDPEMIGF